MSYDSLRNPQNYERNIGSDNHQDHDLPDAPKCCGVPMCWDGGNYYYCDECGKEVQK